MANVLTEFLNDKAAVEDPLSSSEKFIVGRQKLAR
jgi:hypothetical protein